MVVNDIRAAFVEEYKKNAVVRDKSGVSVLELCGVSFTADENHIFGAPNTDYIRREIQWYDTMIRNINAIPEPIPRIWKEVAGEDGYVNSNYGWCVYSIDNVSQYRNVLRELQLRPLSRRAVMIYTRPQMWSDYNCGGASDFMCTNAVQYLLRSSTLHAVVQMRSNDAWAGYRNDYAWQRTILERLSSALQVTPGTITWQCGSLHLYDKQFYLLENYINTGATQ